jgi:uncharacterized membrane protein YoaK (UPF0700 family)
MRNRDLLEKGALVLVLPFVAGAVNASGFFIVGVYTSHVTGNVARVGDELAQGHGKRALQAALLIFTFLLGAMLSTLLVDRARKRGRARYVGPLMAESAMLMLVTFLGLAQPRQIPAVAWVIAGLLSMAMGAQNALVTKLSGAVVRTTHLTGIVTDMGIELIRAWEWARATAANHSVWAILRQLRHPRRIPELRRLRLHLAIASSFVGGALLGPLLYLSQGLASMLLPVIVLLGLVSFDHLVGLRATDAPFERHAPADSVPHHLTPETTR